MSAHQEQPDATNNNSTCTQRDNAIRNLLQTVTEVTTCIKQMYSTSNLKENTPLFFLRKGNHVYAQYSWRPAKTILLNSRRKRSVHRGICIYKFIPDEHLPSDLRMAWRKKQIELKHINRKYVHENLEMTIYDDKYCMKCVLKTTRGKQLQIDPEITFSLVPLNSENTAR